MEYVKFRKYPRVYKKKHPQSEEKSITLSGAAAVGILALAFLKGAFWGYIIKKKMG